MCATLFPPSAGFCLLAQNVNGENTIKQARGAKEYSWLGKGWETTNSRRVPRVRSARRSCSGWWQKRHGWERKHFETKTEGDTTRTTNDDANFPPQDHGALVPLARALICSLTRNCGGTEGRAGRGEVGGCFARSVVSPKDVIFCFGLAIAFSLLVRLPTFNCVWVAMRGKGGWFFCRSFRCLQFGARCKCQARVPCRLRLDALPCGFYPLPQSVSFSGLF